MQSADQGASDQQDDEKQTESRAQRMEKGIPVHVRDPTTGDMVTIRNMKGDEDTQPGENVLKMELPEPDWDEHRDHILTTSTKSIHTLAITYASSLLLLFLPLPLLPSLTSSSWLGSFFRLIIGLAPPALVTITLLNKLRNTAHYSIDTREWHSERIRGLRAGDDLDRDGEVEAEERLKESAEWANSLLRGLWPVMNPDLFSSLVDMLEDIMQGSVPSFIHSVRVSDLGLGENPLRITSIRALPDGDTKDALESLDTEDREMLSGDHVNLEVSFAYRALPSGTNASSKAKNAHLLIDFFLGISSLVGVSVPVWVEMKGAIGTARVRLQLIPDPPFVKTTLVTLLGLPRIDIGVTAMSRALPNVMNLPFISGFISSSIDTAAAEYVAPKSLILDMQRLIGGSDVSKDTEALGVLVVHVHRATAIKKMDTIGSSESSDPYVTLTFSQLGKPLFSTRIIKGDLNPVFEEVAILPVDLNVVRLKEELSVQLWDSDRASADDMMGYVNVDITDLMRHKNEPHRRIAHLTSPDSSDRPGTVEFTIGYFGKLAPSEAHKTSGVDPGIPEDLRESNEFKEAKDVALNDLEAAVLVCPPDEEWVSGIVGVQVHEIRELGVGRGGRKGDEGGLGVRRKVKEGVGMGVEETEKGSDEGAEKEEGEGLPSSYCTISLNDELIYQTRVKPISSSPIFNAGCERFIRDWRTSHVTVTVKDSRMRENDAILGVVLLKLSDLFVNASQLTRVYHLEHGLGHGRIRISVLFRPVAAKLPPNLRGFDTGTLHVRDVSVRTDESEKDMEKCELRLKTTTTSMEQKDARHAVDVRGDGEIVWMREETETVLPVRQRYSAALVVAFKHGGIAKGKHALGVLWLRDIVDREERKIEIPLWREEGKDYSRLKQNYVPPSGDLSAWDSDREKLDRIGTITLDTQFLPGISEAHRGMLTSENATAQDRWDEVEMVRRHGGREEVGELQVATPQKVETPQPMGTPAEEKGNEAAAAKNHQPEGEASHMNGGQGEQTSPGRSPTQKSQSTNDWSNNPTTGHSPADKTRNSSLPSQGTNDWSNVADTGHSPARQNRNSSVPSTAPTNDWSHRTTDGHSPARNCSLPSRAPTVATWTTRATDGHDLGPDSPERKTRDSSGPSRAPTNATKDSSARATAGHSSDGDRGGAGVGRNTSLQSAAPTQYTSFSNGYYNDGALISQQTSLQSPISPQSPTSTRNDSNTAAHGHEDEEEDNTMVSHEKAEEDDGTELREDGHQYGDGDAEGYDVVGDGESYGSGSGSSGSGEPTAEGDSYEGGEGTSGDSSSKKKLSPMKKLKNWKQQERELHMDHRGIMQVKPARTAVWMKDNVKQSVHSMKEHFTMESRQPDVETEV